MRKIGIRKFHQNMWEEIKDLPVIVTNRGAPIFIVDVLSNAEFASVIVEEVNKDGGKLEAVEVDDQ